MIYIELIESIPVELQDVIHIELDDNYVEPEEVVDLRGDKGDKGDKGERGEKGAKGDTGDRGEKGEKGDRGNDGKDGKDGADGKDGKDGSSDTAQEIIDKINSLETDSDDKKIDAKHIKNLPEYKIFGNGVQPSSSTGGAGITDGDKGDIIVSSGGTVWELDPAGAISNYPTTTTVSGWLSEYMPYIDSLVNTVQYDTLLMSGDTDDYDTIGKGVLFINASGAYRLSGVKSMGNGAILRINNYGDSTVTLSHQDMHSSLYNQFFLPKGQNITLDTGEGCMFVWNNDVRNWMYIDTFAVKSIVAGAGISVDNTDPAAPLISATGITRIILTVSGAVAAGSNANTDYVYFCNNSTTITLPTAIGNTNQYTIKNTSTGRSVTIATTGGQLIEGALTAVLPLDPPSVDIYSDGTKRFIT